MKTIAVANQKGGVAKSTTCWEIGTCLKDMGYKVLVIDFDQQSNLTGYVNADRSKPSIYDCLKADASMEDAIQVTEDFDFISASEKLSKADKEFSAPEDIYLLKELLKFIEDDYDFAIIDNSPSRNSLLNMSYIAADFVIIPTECDTGSIDGIDAIYGDLTKYRKINWTNAQVAALILTKFENTAMHTLAYEQLEEKSEEMEEHPFVMKVRKGIKVSESKLAMQSLQRYDHYSNPAFDYRDIAKALVERLGVN
ncbi:MAG: ParA family protein [Lachnospiraceae bacterium]|nr:ParA family protein [Lachnospiraceae bacterium]